VHAIHVTQAGGPEVLTWAELDDPTPGPGEVLVRVEAAGVNFIDVYRRTGLYPVPLPSVPGSELAGTVVAVGPGVQGPAPGDRVASADADGGYAELAVLPAGRTVPVPPGVSAEQAAAVLLQGMTVQYLTTDAFALGAGHRCLVHAAAGGVGALLVQTARRLGAEVFATVGSADKVEVARAAGAQHVIVTGEQDFVGAVQDLAGPRPIDVVYDGVGRDTFAGGLKLLRRRGTMVSFGNASGPVEPVSPLALASNGSLFLTRPMLSDYVADTEELRARAADVLGRVADGQLTVRIGARLELARAADAHRLLESRRSTGKIVLTVGRE
jgi:NADPH2:quinone reductase